MREVEDSLRRLKTDWIDLYQIHRPEDDTDIDETLGALTDLVRAGKVRAIGSSTFPASRIVEAQWVAEKRGRERFVCEQPPYSMLVRGIETRRAADLPAPRHGRDPLEPARRRLAVRAATARAPTLPQTHRAERIPRRYDMSLPGNQRKLEAADALAGARRGGRPEPHPPRARLRDPPPGRDRGDHRPADAWSSSSPSSAPPRSSSPTTCSTASTRSSRPASTLNPTDAGYDNPALRPAARRR